MENYTTVAPYKLAQHLKDVCSQHEEYANLLSVWQMNRDTCHDILENVILNYPHYTTHDLSHSESIITNIEMLLGEQAIRTLSPTDTWLLLQAAYLHDFGMVILFEDVKKHWETEEFQDYLKELEGSNDSSLSNAAKYINQLKDNLAKDSLPLSWPIQIRRYVTFIVADYFRGRHASLSKDYLQRFARDWGLDLSYNGLIPQRLLYLLGEISYLHTENLDSILQLDYTANGFSSDYIHPRFVAEMLRLGDLLDVDNNRFNPYTEKVSGARPETSMSHIQKHLAATHIMISPTQIEYRADCLDEQTFRETQRFVTWLKEEVHFLAVHWLEIMPQAIKGTAPRLKEPELLLRGEPDILGTTDLRFSISQEKAFELIEGSNIYEDSFIFIRELIQNALDACKLQLWDDLCNGKYRAWIKEENLHDIKPFHIEQKIYENYRVQVFLEEQADNTIKIIVKDNGIGITKQAFQRICNVGTSYAGDNNWKNTLKNMPLWLKPTAGFGIGLQSVFLATDRFEFYSKAQGECIHAIVESRKKDGYVQIRQSDREMENGTEMHVCIPKEDMYSYRFDSYTSEYLHTKYDPITDKNQVALYSIVDTILSHCQKTFFPLEVFMEDENFFQSDIFEWDNLVEEENDYHYQWITKYTTMQLWDMQNDAMFIFQLMPKYTMYNHNEYFKGIELRNTHIYNANGCSYTADFYGLDTKKYITLDRKNIKKEYTREIAQIIHNAYHFFLNKIWQKLQNASPEANLFSNQSKENLLMAYSYWCQSSLEQKEILFTKFSNMFQNLKKITCVLKRNHNGRYSLQYIKPTKIWKKLYQSAYIDTRYWRRYDNKSDMKPFIKEILEVINHIHSIEYPYIVIDNDFAEIFTNVPHKKITICSIKKETITIFSYNREEIPLLTLTDAYTKQFFLLHLASNSLLNKPTYSPWLRDSLRMSIPAIDDYPELAVNRHIPNVANQLFYSKNNIVSPITAKDIQQLNTIGRDGFVTYITGLPAYEKLLDFVEKNQLEPAKYSRKEIDNAYRKLIEDYLQAIE